MLAKVYAEKPGRFQTESAGGGRERENSGTEEEEAKLRGQSCGREECSHVEFGNEGEGSLRSGFIARIATATGCGEFDPPGKKGSGNGVVGAGLNGCIGGLDVGHRGGLLMFDGMGLGRSGGGGGLG